MVKVPCAKWKTGVACRLGSLKIIVERAAGIEIDDFSTRRHYLAHETPAHLKGVGDNLLADQRDFSRFRAFIQDQAQFFLTVRQLGFSHWIEVQYSFQEPIRQPIQQPD